MSYQKERDEFIGQMAAEIMAASGTNNQGVDLARLILRNAQTIQRCEERACSDEAAERDKVPCPAIKSGNAEDCACDSAWYKSQGQEHGPGTRPNAADPSGDPASTPADRGGLQALGNRAQLLWRSQGRMRETGSALWPFQLVGRRGVLCTDTMRPKPGACPVRRWFRR